MAHTFTIWSSVPDATCDDAVRVRVHVHLQCRTGVRACERDECPGWEGDTAG